MTQQKRFNFNFDKTNSSDQQTQSKESVTKVPEAAAENSKTLLTFAKEIGMDKQVIYRCVKKNKIEYKTYDSMMYIDEAAQSKIISILNENKKANQNQSRRISNSTSKVYQKHFEAAFKMLQKELEIKTEQLNEKDKQIAELIQIIEGMKKDGN